MSSIAAPTLHCPMRRSRPWSRRCCCRHQPVGSVCFDETNVPPPVQIPALEQELLLSLLPKDGNDARGVVLEVGRLVLGCGGQRLV